MESWKENLEGMYEEELEEQFEDEFFLQMLEAGSSGVLDEPSMKRKRGGSTVGRKFLFCDRETYHTNLYNDYFSETPTYGPMKFRRCFRMRRVLFLRVVDSVVKFDPWFEQKIDGLGWLGLSSLQKCTTTIHMLAYGMAADAFDEYCPLEGSTAHECLRRFVIAIRGSFESRYLRQPTREDFECQMRIYKDRGFLGMFGSLDCMHWTWKNCLVAWQGQFQDKDKNGSIILQAIAFQSLWIWHAFFCLPRENNDIKVLDRSPLILDMLRGPGKDLSFEVNGHHYPGFYLLSDGIYPPWSCFIQPIHEPQGEMKEYLAKCQEGARKDVERALGVLQARWAIIKNPLRQWSLDIIENIMMACIVMYNMIIEDEQGLLLEPFDDWGLPTEATPLPFTFLDLQYGTRELENVDSHFALRNDLIEHL